MSDGVRVPQSISQAILRTVVAADGWATFEHICSTVLPAGNWRQRAAISARLGQFAEGGKLKRRGQPGAYQYHATKTSLLDLRKVNADGKPRQAKTAAVSVRARREPAPPAARAAARAQAKPLPHQHMSIPPPPARMTDPPRSSVQRESVESFRARGGRIEILPLGAVSKPLKSIGAPAPAPRVSRARKPTSSTTE